MTRRVSGWVRSAFAPPRLRRRTAGSHPLRREGRTSAHSRVVAEAARTQAVQTERGRLAAAIDAELRVACRADTTARRALGDAARALLARRGYQRLGFVRLGDYARERLGLSGATLQVAAWMSRRLDELPLVGAALDGGELTWSQARAICRAARPNDQRAWLTRAQDSSAAELEAEARAVEIADCPEDATDDSDEIDGEPAVRLRLACPARIRALWRRAVAVAARVAGEPLAAWQAAEIVAAEAFAGRPAAASFGDRWLLAGLRLTRRGRRLAARASGRFEGGVDVPSPLVSPIGRSVRCQSSTVRKAAASPNESGIPQPRMHAPEATEDPFALDARLIAAVGTLSANEPRIGRLLRLFVDQRFHRCFGVRSVEAYVRERLGISTRKAWALLKIERRRQGIPAFADRYTEGRLSWVRALTLLPVIDRGNAAAWLARADEVTVRRLVDEVNWVLEVRDVSGGRVSLDPPPLASALDDPRSSLSARRCCRSAASPPVCRCREASLASGVRIGTGDGAPGTVRSECHETSLGFGSEGCAGEVADAEVTFEAPASVVALVRDTMDAFARPHEPRWSAFERVLRHAIRYWESLPRHRDPVFARDGWRCTVPICSSRRNLHDHHVQYRSRGGGNAPGNRTTICAAHHLHGIHAGTVRVRGSAPDALHWELGVRAGAPPLLEYVGDRRV